MTHAPWWFKMKEGKHGEYVQSWSSFDNPPDIDQFEMIKILEVLKEVGEEEDEEADHEDNERDQET
jgi:hypothetical protein